MSEDATTLWGGRFSEGPDDALWQLTVDVSDRRLLAVDVAGSQAHVEMLSTVGVLDGAEFEEISAGLETIAGEAADGVFRFYDSDEDVHTAVERRLSELIGETAGKLHTGRSRNDQVSLDLRMYLAENGADRIGELSRFIGVLADAAEANADVVVSSYTHMQPAQVVSFGHHLMAYTWMLLRDVDRLAGAVERLSVSPLGAGASGGSSLHLDPALVADSVGFRTVFDNSLDAVAARDFVAEYAFVCAQAMAHLSRLAEELVLWATEEFAWVTFDDAHTTGSSALPQKKNPDIAELVRGKTATVIGDVTALLTLQKGLPLSYNRDLQEDKRAVFHADDTLRLSIAALSGMVRTADWHPRPPSSWVTALDLAEILVTRGVPFREAHAAVGVLVADLIADGRDLSDATASDLSAAHAAFADDDVDRTSPVRSLEMRITPGGGSSASVASQLVRLRALLRMRTDGV